MDVLRRAVAPSLLIFLFLPQVKENLKNLLEATTDNILTKSSAQNLRNLNVLQATTIKKLNTGELSYNDKVTPNPVEDMAVQAASIRAKVLEHRSKINKIDEKLQDLVRVDRAENITGKKVKTCI